jgi:hypothetical protein
MLFPADHFRKESARNTEFLVTISKTNHDFTPLETTDLCLSSHSIAGSTGNAVKPGDQTFAGVGTFADTGGRKVFDFLIMSF